MEKAATNVVLNIRLFVSYQRRISIYGLKPLGKNVVLGTMRKIVNELSSTELNCFSITSVLINRRLCINNKLKMINKCLE